ncbi:hypothetical protein E3P94_01663 [Wallemia ichthyophaga]|nr:hypothetical protein E3P95_01531 [Wallemia ichthyophaga]TIB01916.1 hypothetical protein E3P94_01663 [Wallemia ichthyophaga]
MANTRTSEELRGESQLIKQGAEARVYLSQSQERSMILKWRFPKKYRHATLDRSLNKQRIQSEVKALNRAESLGVQVPRVVFTDSRDGMVAMEWLNGYSVREWLGSKAEGQVKADDGMRLDMKSVGIDRDTLMQLVGEQIAVLHLSGIIHGDLTTSNLILKHHPNAVYIIDFGLSSLKPITHYTSAEDRAVDLYVLERAFGSTHPAFEAEYTTLLNSYARRVGDAEWNKVNIKLHDVRLRGRKKSMVG